MRKGILRPEVAWPSAIVLLLVAGIASAFAVLYFSRTDGGPEIVTDYYARGLAWDSTASAANAVRRLGWTMSLEPADTADGTGTRSVLVRIADSTGSPVPNLSIDVEASRPHLARPVASAGALAHVEPGSYVAWLPVREPGLWDFTVRGKVGDTPFVMRFRRDITR